MSFFYDPTDRDARLSVLEGGFTWVVLLDDEHVGASYPELAFEGARVLSCRARTAGAKPLLLMTWSKNEPAVEARAEHAYRVGNGTGTPVVPTGAGDVSGGGGAAGSPQVPAGPDVEGALRGAAAVYIALSGHAAAGTTYMAPGFAPAAQAALLAQADAAASLHASLTHYTMPYASAVRLETGPTKGDFTFMDSGTSSEALWHDRMNEIVPKLGMTPKGTAIGACNDQKVFDAVCLANAQPSFAAAQFQILFARSYAISAADVLAAGKQKSLTVQIWDRHYDGLAVDGLAAIGAIDERSMTALSLARAYGLAWTPYHLTFAKLKTARPAVALTTDGTHATYPVSYALAAMSMISRTSMQLSTAGLDDDTAAAVRFADETVRQVARLSVWEAFVPDDPATRPKVSP